MRRPLLRSALVLVALASAGAALAAQQAPRDTTRREAPPRRARSDRSRLLAEDIAGAGNVATALDAVRLLRPWWLNPPMGRIASTNFGAETRAATALVVYIDGLRQPDLESALVTVKAGDVVEMRYLDQNRAVQQWGPGHEAGAIEVTTLNAKRKP